MSVSLKVLKSSALLLSLQIIQRGLGIISTLILARLLTPEDFGIVALIVIALQFFELMIEIGSQQYITQKTTLSSDDLNTAWTMDVITKSGMAVLIIICSSSISKYFDSPDLALALSISAITLPLRALKSPGMMKLVREINYKPMFRLTLWQKGLSFITVVCLAILHPSYWAIIIGNLVSASVLTFGSYRILDFRPRWTIIHLKTQWKFSQWLLLRGIVGFTRSQIDNLIVSKFFGITGLGGYNLVRDISLLPALSIIIPMSEPLLAAIADGKKQTATLAFRTRVSLWLIICILTPITVFIMAYPKLIGLVLLGDNWKEYISLLRPFGLFFFTFCLFALISDAIVAQGKVKLLFWLDVMSTWIIILFLLGTATESLQTMAWVRGWLAVITTICYMLILNHQVSFGLKKLVRLCIPVVVGSLIAYFLTNLLPLENSSILVEFIIRGFSHVIIAIISTIGLAMLLLRRTEEWYWLIYLFSTLRPGAAVGKL